MTKHTKKTSFLKRFKQDTQGTMAVMWGVSLSAVVIAVGSAYDFNKVSAARQQSVAVADMLALNAAVYIRDNDGDAPSSDSEGFRNNRQYYLEDIGISIAPYDDKQATQRGRKGRNKDREAPYFKIKYDYPEQGMVTAFIHGQSRPAFMGFIGIDNVDFSAASTVSYQVKDLKDPASIGLVMDNSGSMGWDDGNGTIRMTGLKSTVNAFMTQMDGVIDSATEEDQERGQNASGENKYVRTGMVTYSNSIKSSKPFDWQVLSTSTVNGMQASGGTNSSGAMAWMNSNMAFEDDIHEDKSGAKPLKYVVFMTDGVNNVTERNNCRPASGHYHWLHWDSWTISENYKGNKSGWYKVWAREYDEWAMYWEEQEICDEISSFDDATIASCGALKAQGTSVYSIGYALTIKETDSEQRRAEIQRANTMLQACSSGAGYFHEAANASVLNGVFQSIGADIVEDTIRIRG